MRVPTPSTLDGPRKREATTGRRRQHIAKARLKKFVSKPWHARARATWHGANMSKHSRFLFAMSVEQLFDKRPRHIPSMDPILSLEF